jgi:O-antigen/teichoic acid export membrane protein
MPSAAPLPGDPIVRRLRRGGLWTVASRTTGMGVVFANHVLLARNLSRSEFGAFLIASSLAVLLSMVAAFGLNTAICRFLAESLGVGDSERARRAARLTAGIALITTTLAAVLIWFVIRGLSDPLFHKPQLVPLAGLIAVWTLLLAVNQLLAEALRGLQLLRAASLLTGVSGGVIANVLLFAGLVGFAGWLPLDCRLVILLALLSMLVPLALGGLCLWRRWPRQASQLDIEAPPLTPLTAWGIVQEAFPLMLVQVISFGMAQLDVWIVGATCSDTELAIYGVARRLSLLVAIPLTQISLAIASTIAELYARRQLGKLEFVLRATATMGAAVTAVVAGLLMAAPGLVLSTAFGPGFGSGGTALRILCAGQLVFALTGPCGPALLMTGRQRVALGTLLAALPIFVVAPMIAVTFGLNGVALVFAAVTTIQNLLQWWAARRLLGIRTDPLLAPGDLQAARSALLGRETPILRSVT